MANNLYDAISGLYDMELNNYLMTRSISQLDDEISSLGKKKYFEEPVQFKAEGGDESVVNATWYSAFGVGMVGAIIAAVIGMSTSGFFVGLLFTFVGLIVGAIIGAIAGNTISKSRDNKIYKEAFDEKKEKYVRNIKNDALRVEEENRKKQYLKRQRDLLVERKTEASRKLNSFYMAVGIDKNYRNLIPIGYMYEFMSLGIATKLEGADGLYYLVRRELRADQMQYTLDEISFKLDTIIDNQHRIYGELTEINNKCDRIISETVKSAELAARNNEMLSVAVANTAITAYNSERIASEAKFQSYMTMYNS